MEQDFGRDVAGDRRLPEGVEGRGIEPVDPLGDTPGGQGTQDADVLSLVRRLESLPPGHDGVGCRQRQEAPVGPVPQLLSAGSELIHLLPGFGIETAEAIEDLAGSEICVGHGIVPSTSPAVDGSRILEVRQGRKESYPPNQPAFKANRECPVRMNFSVVPIQRPHSLPVVASRIPTTPPSFYTREHDEFPCKTDSLFSVDEARVVMVYSWM